MMSEAYSIEAVGTELWIGGTAYNRPIGRWEAVTWHYTPDAVPEPSSLLALGGGMGAVGLALRRRRA